MEEVNALSVSRRRNAASEILTEIAGAPCLQTVTAEVVNRVAREAMIALLFLRWRESGSAEEEFGIERLVSLSCHDSEQGKPLLSTVIEEVSATGTRRLADLISELVLLPKDGRVRSLAETMSIHDVTMDLFLRDHGLGFETWSERRGRGIHYTPWDLAVWMAGRLRPQETGAYRVLDPAMGCGIFLLACREVFRDRDIHLSGGDIDPVAVFSTRLQMREVHGRGITDGEIRSRFVEVDYLSESGFDLWRGADPDAVIMNPPYVSQSIDRSFVTRGAKNLAAYFIERSLEVVDSGGQIVAVVPISIATGGKRYSAVRQLILDKASKVSVKHVDIVPGYLFSQGKYEGSGASRSVSARVSIYDIGVGEGATAFESTRFIRWMTRQRSEMMSIEPEEIGAEEVCLFTPDCFPMGGRLDLELLRKITDEAPMTLGEARSEGGQYCLQVLKPARYHISADVNVSDRKNTAIIRFETRDERDAAMAVMVSGAFFWYWRCHGNGMQLRMKEIDGFPWPQSGVRELAEVGRGFAQMLDEEVFQVRSKNKGEYTSAAFRGGLDLIDEADSIITNSLVGDKVDYSGFFASTRYPDAKYSSSVPYKLGRKMRHTTPKGERDAVYHLIKDRLKGLADSESRTMSMQEMYDYIVMEDGDRSSGFELSEVQLSMHRQRTGPVEENFKHDLKNSLSNGKRLGEVISPASDSWGWPRPADWMDDVVDPVEWEGFVQNAKDHLPGSNKKFEIVAVRGDEILVKRPKKGGRTHSITRSLVNSKVLHLMYCGGVMEASSIHAYVDMREALIALHPRIDFLRSNPKKIRFLRKSG